MLSKNNDQIQLAKYLGIWKIYDKALAEKKRKGPWELLWSLIALQPREPSPVHHRHQGNSCFYLRLCPEDCAEETGRQPPSGTSVNHSLLQAVFVV